MPEQSKTFESGDSTPKGPYSLTSPYVLDKKYGEWVFVSTHERLAYGEGNSITHQESINPVHNINLMDEYKLKILFSGTAYPVGTPGDHNNFTIDQYFIIGGTGKALQIQARTDGEGRLHSDNDYALQILVIDTDFPVSDTIDESYVCYYQHGRLHREDGPAVIRSCVAYGAVDDFIVNESEWWINGERNMNIFPNLLVCTGDSEEFFMVNDDRTLSRNPSDGPAFMDSRGNIAYIENGKLTDKVEQPAISSEGTAPQDELNKGILIFEQSRQDEDFLLHAYSILQDRDRRIIIHTGYTEWESSPLSHYLPISLLGTKSTHNKH